MTRTGAIVIVVTVVVTGSVAVSVGIIWDIGSTNDKISAGRCYRS